MEDLFGTIIRCGEGWKIRWEVGAQKSMSAIRVGIPRALGYYEYYPMWRSFFKELGADVVLSARTNKRILDQGVQMAVDDACLPIKVFYGHVFELRDKVDYIFIPRIVSVEKKVYTCPKFLGLPEMIKTGVPDLPPIIDLTVNITKDEKGYEEGILRIGRLFVDDDRRIERAYKSSVKALRRYKEYLVQGHEAEKAMKLVEKNGTVPIGAIRRLRHDIRPTLHPSKFSVMLLGHPYMLNDEYVNLNIIKKLEKLGANVMTCECVPDSVIQKETDRLPKRLFWTFAKRTMGAALHHLQRGGVDGLIHLIPFGCGSDALISELVERFARRVKRIPFMLLTIDEHSGEAGFMTRLEAFTDMVMRRKSRS